MLDNYDNENLLLIRENVERFWQQAAAEQDGHTKVILDTAPQAHGGIKKYIKYAEVDTLDIDPSTNPDYCFDLCEKVRWTLNLPINYFDAVICTEVLEHTKEPWTAIKNIYFMLRSGGILYGSTPLDLRIHGPLPDCYRFTEHGLKYLLEEVGHFNNVTITPLVNPERPLFPIHYTFRAEK